MVIPDDNRGENKDYTEKTYCVYYRLEGYVLVDAYNKEDAEERFHELGYEELAENIENIEVEAIQSDSPEGADD